MNYQYRAGTIIKQLVVLLALCGTLLLAGCERKETILDVETPIGGVEVERSTSDGSVDVEVGRRPAD